MRHFFPPMIISDDMLTGLVYLLWFYYFGDDGIDMFFFCGFS